MHADVLSSSAIKRRGWILSGDSFLWLCGKDTRHVSTLVPNWGQNTKGALRNSGNIRTQTLHQTRFHSPSWLEGSWNARLKIIAFFGAFCGSEKQSARHLRSLTIAPGVGDYIQWYQHVYWTSSLMVGKVCSDYLSDKEKLSWVSQNVNQ